MQHSLHRSIVLIPVIIVVLIIPMIIILLIIIMIIVVLIPKIIIFVLIIPLTIVTLLIMINCVMRALSSGLSEGWSRSPPPTSIAGTLPKMQSLQYFCTFPTF